MSAVATDIADSFKLQGITQKKALLTTITPGIAVDGHSKQIHLIIENILANAMFYTPAESQVEFHLCSSNDMARLTVRDYGQGVPNKDLSAIFRSFYRVDASRAQQIITPNSVPGMPPTPLVSRVPPMTDAAMASISRPTNEEELPDCMQKVATQPAEAAQKMR